MLTFDNLKKDYPDGGHLIQAVADFPNWHTHFHFEWDIGDSCYLYVELANIPYFGLHYVANYYHCLALSSDDLYTCYAAADCAVNEINVN